ncbi:hypothetical protein DERF_015056 [Dermatophagoides farinae]|uniref:Uncharacterized protein n=1 Tax=Dermatophagoides farinae TaxID=6954 RepID=A0A922KVL0_DERFA|nr:hypothetical protein DERF_015056 [Dermatophagoides farinae]
MLIELSNCFVTVDIIEYNYWTITLNSLKILTTMKMEPIFRWARKMAIAIRIHQKSNSDIWTNSCQTLG